MRTAAVAMGAVAVLVAGCGSGDRLAGPPSSTTASSGGGATASRPSASRPMTVTGLVTQGAEPSCLILSGPHGGYELQGPLAEHLRVGMRVRVTGRIQHGVASHCMQGVPFEVTSIDSP